MPTTILLVDDDERNLDVLEALLKPFEAACVRASDGRTALALVEAAPPDLVLLDLSMPGLDGIDVLLHLRGSPHLEGLPVVLVTAHAEREQRLRAIEAGADDFLEKPVDAAILKARVNTLLRLRRSRLELENAKKELEAQNRALVSAEQAKRELQQFIVHDLKGPLTALVLDLDWLQRSATEGPVRSVAEDAASSAARLREMVEDLLATSRLDATDGMPVHREHLAIDELVRDVMRAHARVAADRGVRIDGEVAGPARVLGDTKLLRRMLENLMDNALRHTSGGGEIYWRVAVDREVVVSVSNSGAAIAPSMRARLFEKFSTAAGERGGRGNLGLGLYFCKRVAEAHEGAIELAADVDLTTFRVRLPRD